MKKYIVVLLILAGFYTSNNLFAQFEPYPEVDWYTIETDNFTVSYHKGAERTAQLTAKISEEIIGPITSLYNYKPAKKTNFVINDLTDYANGATDFYNDRIEIFASALDFEFRGTHNWLRNVITHEYTHMVTLQASMKLPKMLPAVYLQWLNYEEEKRPDVLYGYPNGIVSYPISGIAYPAWFAEGVAQYQRQQLGYEKWDSQRDMILRSRVISGNMLSYNEMGQFSSVTSLKAESIYNSGYALVRYISKKYGEDKLKDLTHHLSDPGNFSMDASFRKSIGKDGSDVYEEWKSYLEKDYETKLKGVRETQIAGEIIQSEGFANLNPKFSPDGKWIAYLSNAYSDYYLNMMYLYNTETKTKTDLPFTSGTTFSWSPDSKKIIFAQKQIPPSLKEISLYDLYEYNLQDNSVKKLTDNSRYMTPAYSFDGKKIVFLVPKDGTMNMKIADNNLQNIRTLTDFSLGEQVYNPQFTPDGKKILFEYSFEEARKIAVMDIESGTYEFILNDKDIDFRNPCPDKDGKGFYYSSDMTGIFNIYYYEYETKKSKQITNVIGGAFNPSIDNKGNLVYSSYEDSGFKIALLKDFRKYTDAAIKSYIPPERVIEAYANAESTGTEPKNNYNWGYLKNFDDKKVPQYKAEKYSPIFNQLSIFPAIRFDNYSKTGKFVDAIKPGIYFSSDELMSRMSLFGGAFINRNAERDLFLQFNYDYGVPIIGDLLTNKLGFYPKFFFEAYNVTRKADAQVIAAVDSINVGVKYNLMEFDLGFEFPIINVQHKVRLEYDYSKYDSDIDPFYIPSSGLSTRGSSQTYFKANRLTLYYHFDNSFRYRNSDINPIGTKVNFRYDYEMSDINPEYTVENDGTLTTTYQKNNLHKIDMDIFQSFGLFHNQHTISLKLRGAVIFGPVVDNFYNNYATGLSGMRGYTYFSLGGGRLATLNMTYRLPIFQRIDTRVSPLYFDKLYFSVFGDVGDAWEESDFNIKNLKKDVGAELRLQAWSFYEFPTSIFVSAAYGLDEFSRIFLNKNVTYGKEWKFYFGVLFGFDI